LGSGEIELKEMIEIIGTLYEMEGVSSESAYERAEKIFSDLDVNSDGSLTEDEFLQGCMDDDELVRLLNAGGIDPDEMNDED
jgi:Ca2+-binding EF-hand superfamily protein